jgi:hypothetical protein
MLACRCRENARDHLQPRPADSFTRRGNLLAINAEAFLKERELEAVGGSRNSQ